jgi:hypothetical protein
MQQLIVTSKRRYDDNKQSYYYYDSIPPWLVNVKGLSFVRVRCGLLLESAELPRTLSFVWLATGQAIVISVRAIVFGHQVVGIHSVVASGICNKSMELVSKAQSPTPQRSSPCQIYLFHTSDESGFQCPRTYNLSRCYQRLRHQVVAKMQHFHPRFTIPCFVSLPQ